MKLYYVLLVTSAAVVCSSLSISNFGKFRQDNPCPTNFTGMVPNPEDCQSFYICDHGYPGLIPCPADLCFKFDGQGSGNCESCELVPGCDGEVPTGAPSTASPSTPEPETTTLPSTQTESTTLPSTKPESTTTPTPETTPEVPTEPPTPETTQAPPSSSTTTTEATSTSSNDLPCPTDLYIYMPYPGDCNKFYYCQSGINTGVYNCGTGLWFHFRQQACALPWGASCE